MILIKNEGPECQAKLFIEVFLLVESFVTMQNQAETDCGIQRGSVLKTDSEFQP